MFDICTDTGVWKRPNLNGHVFDINLCGAISKVLKNHKINEAYDLGCGHGTYTKFLRSIDFDCEGFDGNPFTKELTGGLCNVLDLSKKCELTPRECVITLEVGEHIPKKYEEVFVDNVNRSAKRMIILSWAVPGQGGEGHFNEQPNEYIRGIFSSLGYSSLEEEEKFLRGRSELPWFKNTIMVFHKNS